MVYFLCLEILKENNYIAELNGSFYSKILTHQSLNTITKSGWYCGMDFTELLSMASARVWCRIFANVQTDNSAQFIVITQDNKLFTLERGAGNTPSYSEPVEFSQFGRIPKGKYDLDNPPSYSIFQAIAGSTNLPTELRGNAAFVLQLATENILYGAMIVFGFGSDKIAIKRKNASEQWSEWRYFSAT